MDNPFANAPIQDAVTAVVEHRGRVLLLHRCENLAAFPGYHAFPGGKVDPGDASHAPHGLKGFDRRRLGALARELREELGLDLGTLAAAGAIEMMAEVGFALTPPLAPRRYATHFFRLRLRTPTKLAMDRREHDGFAWAKPEEWLARYARGRLLLAPPTLMALRDLAENADARSLPSLQRLRHPRRWTHADAPIPESEPVAGVGMLFVRSNTLPPAAHTNALLVGDEGSSRLLVDPSPADDAEYAKLRQQVTGRFDAIFLTHHHPDHHERADRLAREAAVPIWCSADTRQRIAGRWPDFFGSIGLREVADGEVLTRWLGRPVRALAVPGHDAGQLALLPEDREWCLVGDLIQGIGTVVIAPPEGNMRAYFHTLERVIRLDPAVIIPSHGQALGGVHYLHAALAHRRQRERQILELHRSGKSEDEMLAEIYADTPAALLELARVNIRSHLDKLREERVIVS